VWQRQKEASTRRIVLSMSSIFTSWSRITIVIWIKWRLQSTRPFVDSCWIV
jgi:hypothetical protein